MNKVQIAQVMYFVVIGIIGMILMIYDKVAAKVAQRHRIPEAVLMAVGIVGGAPLMYITMLFIRHKTRKPKFSVGFPIMILLQAAAVTALNAWILN